MAIRRRGDKWTVKVYDSAAPGRQRWVGTFDTPGEAADAERAATLGIAPSARARTIRDWSMIWLRDYARASLSTRRTYQYAVERINADVGDLLLARLDRPTARRLAREWPRGTTRVARTMLADAHRDGLIAANPFTNLRLETPKGRKDLHALSEVEIGALADAALAALGDYGRQFRALLIFLAYVGCRPGELCCIRRDDLDIQRGEVVIRFSLDGQGGEKAPKNGKPRIAAPPPPAKAVRRRRRTASRGSSSSRRRRWPRSPTFRRASTARTCSTPAPANASPRPCSRTTFARSANAGPAARRSSSTSCATPARPC